MGIYATRSPHRANPIGTTLCKLDRIQIDGPHNVTLHVSGLDLVDGTPVFDIKPYVPVYDSVNDDEIAATASNTTILSSPTVPSWVDEGLETSRNVTITVMARQELRDILEQDPKALDFYGPHQGDSDVTAAYTSMMDCIQQVLAMDVRSSFQTQKTRKGKFQAERAQRVQSKFGFQKENGTAKEENAKVYCTQQLDNLIIEYQVQETEHLKREASENSGAEDLIVVKSIKLLRTS